MAPRSLRSLPRGALPPSGGHRSIAMHCNHSTSKPGPPPPPFSRARGEAIKVAKLIDISKCIGCKACQVACMEWNDLRDEVGRTRGVRQPARSDRPVVDRDALLRSGGRAGQAGVADPQGRLHALRDPGCSRPARRGAIVQYGNASSTSMRKLHRLRLLHHRLPVQRSAHLEEGRQGLQVHALFRPRRGGPGAGVRQDLPDRAIVFGSKRT